MMRPIDADDTLLGVVVPMSCTFTALGAPELKIKLHSLLAPFSINLPYVV